MSSTSTLPRARLALALLAALLACAGGGDDAGPAGPTGPTRPTVPTGPAGPPGWPELARAEADGGGLAVRLFSDRSAGTGLAALAISIADATGAPVTDAAVTATAARVPFPGGASAPLLAPPALAGDGTYRVEAVFPEPAGAGDGYVLSVDVARPGAAPVRAALGPFAVSERGLARTFGAAGAAGAEHLLAVRFDAGIRVGVNPITVALLARATPGGPWSPAEAASITVTPFMPSMGHGAPGSVPPAPSGAPGRYAGAVGLSMPGDWDVTFGVTRAGALVGEPVVSIYF